MRDADGMPRRLHDFANVPVNTAVRTVFTVEVERDCDNRLRLYGRLRQSLTFV